MISKETFCKALSMRDEQVRQESGSVAEIVPNRSEDALCLLLSELFDDEQNLISLSVGIEDDPLQAKSLYHPDEEIDLHSYEELYDYLTAYQKMHYGGAA